MNVPNPPTESPSGILDAEWEARIRGPFPTTHWGVIRSAAADGSPTGSASLDALLSRYRPTVLRYLTRRFHVPREQAEDLWQGFVASRILEGRLLSRANPRRGRFRNLMLRALDRHVIGHLRQEAALKRCPAKGLTHLETLADHECPAAPSAADDDSELDWARAVLAGALLNMRLDCERQGYQDIWTVFNTRVLLPILEDADPLDYPVLVERCHFGSATQACNALSTAKRMFRRHLAAVVKEYAGDNWEAADELRWLQLQLQTRH